MAGGSGSRFWPQSREARPKQLLNLLGSRSMIQATVDRVAPLVPPERLLVATSARLAVAIAEQLPELPPEAILAEPCQRDTAPCIGLAAMLVDRRDRDATLAVLPADHIIEPADQFLRAIRFAADLVDQRPGSIVTFGIKPHYPAETFGYIERGPQLEQARPEDPPAFETIRFREKPDAATARQYLAAGNFLWNGGIFVWKAKTILDALAEHQPEMHARLATIAAAHGSPDFPNVLLREFTAIKRISIDYAVMEHARDVIVVEPAFHWDDVGSWQALARLAGTNAEGHTVVGDHLDVAGRGLIVHNSEPGHLVVTLGLSDCLVVHTPDATLVANKHDEEAIRQVVKLLRERGWEKWL
jgi:mannose-1-phosphate guanylyltransferase